MYDGSATVNKLYEFLGFTSKDWTENRAGTATRNRVNGRFERISSNGASEQVSAGP